MAKIILFTKQALAQVWHTILTKYYEVDLREDVREVTERVLDSPPDLLILELNEAPEEVRGLIATLKENLNLATLPVLLILSYALEAPEWEDLPIDDFFFEDATADEVLSRVHLAFKRIKRISDNNPLTGLPGNTSILRAIQQKLDRREKVAFCYVDLDHFKPFNDRYGFARGDEILRMVGRLISNTVFFHAEHEGFVGHIGGDDFVFICPQDKVETVAKEIIQNFDRIIPHFLDAEDLAKGYFEAQNRRGELELFPFPSISIAIVPNHSGRFKHYGEVAAVAAQVKKMAKKIPGSSYFIDRRKGPYRSY